MTIRAVDLPAQPKTWLCGDGIVYHDLSGFTHLSIDMAVFLYQQRAKLVAEQPVAVIMLAEDMLTLDFEVQTYACHPQLQLTTQALAVVGESFMVRHFVDVFISYHVPDYPVRHFTAEAEAKDWLLALEQISDQSL